MAVLVFKGPPKAMGHHIPCYDLQPNFGQPFKCDMSYADHKYIELDNDLWEPDDPQIIKNWWAFVSPIPVTRV